MYIIIKNFGPWSSILDLEANREKVPDHLVLETGPREVRLSGGQVPDNLSSKIRCLSDTVEDSQPQLLCM